MSNISVDLGPIAVGAAWVAGITAFTILVIRGQPWWGLAVLMIAASAGYQNKDGEK